MKILTLNIEGTRHVPEVLKLLTTEKADVVCLQEIMPTTFAELRDQLGVQGFFAPMVGFSRAVDKDKQWGIAILTGLPASLTATTYYDNFSKDYPEMGNTRGERPLAVLLVVTVGTEEVVVATTHFTWSPGGEVTEEQRVNLTSLLPLITAHPSLVLCGDFNAPRGTEIHQALSQILHDTLPPTVTTTLDPVLHRSGRELVVDGIFVTRNLLAQGTRVVSGVSDHCAIITEVNPSS